MLIAIIFVNVTDCGCFLFGVTFCHFDDVLQCSRKKKSKSMRSVGPIYFQLIMIANFLVKLAGTWQMKKIIKQANHD